MARVAYSDLVGKKQANEPFNAAFSKLKERIAPAARPPPRAPPRREPPPPPPPPREATEDELWSQATTGVAPLPDRPAVAVPAPPARPPEPFWHPDLEALKELEALVSGEAPFDLADSDEFIEGRVPGLDPGIVRRLRKGEFAVQGHLDLHGLTREEAKGAVDRYLREARQAGKRCVLLVHGRGMHSKDQDRKSVV